MLWCTPLNTNRVLPDCCETAELSKHLLMWYRVNININYKPGAFGFLLSRKHLKFKKTPVFRQAKGISEAIIQ